MRDPLAYYRNNTMTTRSLLNAAVKGGVNRFIFSSTAAVYGNPDQVPVPEHAPTRPMSPYGSSKLMTEIMLHDVAAAHGMDYVALRYFNVAGADPLGRIGLATTARPICSRSRSKPPPASAPRSTCSEPIIRRPTAAASAISSMSATSRRRIARRCLICAAAELGHAELRLRPRLFGAGNHRGGPPRRRCAISRFSMRRAGPATS